MQRNAIVAVVVAIVNHGQRSRQGGGGRVYEKLL